jgi:histidine triad (HIT) family protein
MRTIAGRIAGGWGAASEYNRRMSDQRTIFDKILDGEIPCHRVYEDDHVLAFLDIGPLSDGHTLVIPKERAATLHELSDEAAGAIGRVLPRIARAVTRATGAEAYNVLQNNGASAHQAVMHVHFHVIPKVGGRGLSIGWSPGSLSDQRAGELVSAIRGELEGS